MNTLTINHAAVWVSVVVAFVLGFLWYDPIFGDSWMSMVGVTPEDADEAGAGVWITNTVSTAIQMYVLAWLFTKMNVDSGMQGAITGVIIAFALNLTAVMTTGMFAQEAYGLAWIEGGFYVVAWGIAGFIMGAWTKQAE
jgi:hypothetical protein